MKEEDSKPNYFRPNFNMPGTMRGIKSLALGNPKDAVDIDPLIEEAEEDADDFLKPEEPPGDIEKDFELFQGKSDVVMDDCSPLPLPKTEESIQEDPPVEIQFELF